MYPENDGTSHRLTFGMCLWLAVAVHIILMEFYVSLAFPALGSLSINVYLQIHFTPGESDRLRQVSYERQLQRGFSRPGSAGVCGDIISERKWQPHDTAV